MDHISEALKSKPQIKPNKLTPLSLAELMARDFPDSEWAIDGLIPANAITVLSAAPASCKTWLLLEIARTVASGNSLFDVLATKQRGVLMIDEENSLQLLQKRLKQLGVDSNLPICFLASQDFRLTDESIKNTIRLCKDEGLGLISFDSLVRLHGADENDATKMAGVFRQFKKLADAGITVLVAHHNRKPGQAMHSPSSEMRGSSDILAAIDCHISLKKDGTRLVLTQSKSRLAQELQPIELEVNGDDDTVEFRFIGSLEAHISKREKLERSIIDLLAEEQGLNQKRTHELLAARGLRVGLPTLKAALEDMTRANLLQAKPGLGTETIYSLMPTKQEVN